MRHHQEPETLVERGRRLAPLAEALAVEHNFALPHITPSSYYPPEHSIRPFILVKRRKHYNNDDYGHGASVKSENTSAEYCDDAERAAADALRMLQYYQAGELEVYDVERQEKCEVQFTVSVTHQKLVTQTAVAKGICHYAY